MNYIGDGFLFLDKNHHNENMTHSEKIHFYEEFNGHFIVLLESTKTNAFLYIMTGELSEVPTVDLFGCERETKRNRLKDKETLDIEMER